MRRHRHCKSRPGPPQHATIQCRNRIKIQCIEPVTNLGRSTRPVPTPTGDHGHDEQTGRHRVYPTGVHNTSGAMRLLRQAPHVAHEAQALTRVAPLVLRLAILRRHHPRSNRDSTRTLLQAGCHHRWRCHQRGKLSGSHAGYVALADVGCQGHSGQQKRWCGQQFQALKARRRRRLAIK